MANIGKIEILSHQSGTLVALLYNFDIGKYVLKAEHREWLKHNIGGYLQRGGSAFVLGMTSRSDIDSKNMKLSRRRVNSVLDLLHKESPKHFNIAFSEGLGERAAKNAGSRDGSEDDRWRAVLISAWSHPEPPPPPPPPPPSPRPVAIDPPVQRRVYAEFISEFSQSSDPADPDSTATLNGLASKLSFRKYGPGSVKEIQILVPSTYVLRRIFLTPDESGSTNLGISTVDICTCKIRYEWGPRVKPYTLLVDSMMLRAAFKNENPTIRVLDRAYAELWLTDPFKALIDRDYETNNSYIVGYGDYLKGRF